MSHNFKVGDRVKINCPPYPDHDKEVKLIQGHAFDNNVFLIEYPNGYQTWWHVNRMTKPAPLPHGWISLTQESGLCVHMMADSITSIAPVESQPEITRVVAQFRSYDVTESPAEIFAKIAPHA